MIKVLMLNFYQKERIDSSKSISVMWENIKNKPTLHDFHVVFFDVTTILNPNLWNNYTGDYLDATQIIPDRLSSEVKEQIETGGVTFLFCGNSHSRKFAKKEIDGSILYGYLNNYFCSPIELGVVNEKGDTFSFKYEELRYYNPLVKKFPKEQITWDCHFSKLPADAKILGVNRAGYPVFAEVPLGNGKLVLLPQFSEKYHTISVLINEIIPQMVHEEEPVFTPKWVSEFTTEFEKNTRSLLSIIDKNKRLLYTEGKLLKKAVRLAFETLGFEVKELPDGTNADLEIFDGEQKAVIEIKGHKNRQSDRKDVLQLLGYSTPEGDAVKGIFVSNSEYCKTPKERSPGGFKQGAIDLGIDNRLTLISTTELYPAVMNVIEGKLPQPKIEKIREKIIKGVGITSLT